MGINPERLNLAEGQTYVEGRNQATSARLIEAAKEAGLAGQVYTTSFGYIVPSSLVDAGDTTIAGETVEDETPEDQTPEDQFDPSEHNVEEVLAYLDGADADEKARVIAAESEATKPRVTITALATEEGK